ncbi:hypothetical protein AAVH_18204 [Aphelenchoides avenae]|nr:hypothetical protein AAVH_18204 [Aphelenchus avenae]
MLVVKVAALEAYKRIAEARLQEYESINRSLQQEVIAAKASNAMVTNSSKEDVENMKEEMRSLEKDLDEAASTIRSLKDDLKSERASSDSWHEAYEEAEHRAQMTDKLWQQSTVFINEKMNEAKKEMEATKETIERLSQENDALKKRAVELEAGSKAQSITAVAVEILEEVNQRAGGSTLRAELEELQSRLEASNATLQAANEKIRSLEAEKGDLSRRLAVANNNIFALQEEVEHVEKERKECQNASDGSKGLIDNLQTQLSLKNEVNDALEERVKTLREELKIASAQLLDAYGKVVSLKEALDKAEQNLTVTRKSLQSANAERKAFEEQVLQAQSRRAKMKTKLADLEKQLADSKTEVEAQKELTAQLADLRRQNEKQSLELDVLKHRVCTVCNEMLDCLNTTVVVEVEAMHTTVATGAKPVK